MAILIEWLLLALLPLAVLLSLFVWSRSRLALIAALLWTLYLPYELAMKHRTGGPEMRKALTSHAGEGFLNRSLEATASVCGLRP